MFVTVRGVVRTANLRMNSTVRVTYLQVLMDGGYVDVTVDSDDANALKDLLDAEVEVTGVAGGKFDGKMQLTGVLIHVSSWANVKILKRAAASPWSLPVTPMDKILTGYHVQDLTQRVRVRGTITYYQPGSGDCAAGWREEPLDHDAGSRCIAARRCGGCLRISRGS